MIETTQPNTGTTELQGTPEEIGKAIYRLLCGMNKETKENV